MSPNPTSRLLMGLIGLMAITHLAGEHAVQAQNAEPPRLVLNVKGPVGRTLGLAFSHDSHRLYEGGFSKVVNVWDVGFNGPQAPPVATPLETLRWELGRANRGRINVLAMSPVANLLAVAGVGGRGEGDITLFDLDRNQVIATFPTGIPGQRPGHVKPVRSLDFSPDGRRLVSVGVDGACWLWTVQADNTWTPRGIHPAEQNDSIDRRPAMFLTPGEFLLTERVIPDNDERWRLAVYGIDGVRRGALPREYSRLITSLARRPDGTRFAAASESGTIDLFETATKQFLRQLTVDGEAGAVAINNQGQLAIGNNRRLTSTNIRKGDSEVILYDLNNDRLIGRSPVAALENVYTLAFSPDGRWLATHDDERQQVLVFDLRAANGMAAPALRLRGRGKEITTVAVRRDPPGAPIRVGFSHDPDRGIRNLFTPAQADIQRFEQPLPTNEFVTPDTFAAGWRIRDVTTGSKLAGQTLEIVNPAGQVAANIVLDVPRTGQYQGNYCFLPRGANGPGAVAIGTDALANIFVYALDGRRLRYYRDHTAEVNSLSVTPDGKYLVSGSKDQTMKLWSLEGLYARTAFPRYSEWGCDFVIEGNSLRVRNVLKSGIAFARQLRDGDEIILYEHQTDQGLRSLQTPQEILREIIACPLFDQTRITSRRGDEVIPARPVVVGWEPLLTLFVDTRDQWAVFTPEGYYDSSDAEGHRLFGWHVNQGRGITPRFLLAETQQKVMERPDVIRRVLELGNVFDALTALNEPPPPGEEPTAKLASSIQATPEVEIQAPLRTQSFPAGQPNIPVQAQVKFPAGSDPANFDVRTFANGRPVPDAAFNPATGTVTATVPNDSKLHQIEVQVQEKDKPVVDAVQQRAELKVRGAEPAAPPKREIHYLSMACKDYRSLPKLQFTHEDVKAVANRLTGEQFAELHVYDPSGGVNSSLLEEQATLDGLAREVEKIKQRLAQRGTAAKDDLLVMFVAGHGKDVGKEFYYIPSNLKDAQEETIKRDAIAWRSVCDLVNGLDCQVVWLLDACRSGAAIESVKELIREANRPSQRFVMASSRANEDSLENDLFTLDGSAGHGAFTYALLDGLMGTDDDLKKEPVLTADKLGEFVSAHVYFNLTGRKQQPCFVPTSSTPEDANPRPIELSLIPKSGE